MHQCHQVLPVYLQPNLFFVGDGRIGVGSLDNMFKGNFSITVIGSVTLLLGFFGSLGALKEVKCMLATYFILLTVLLAAQIIGTVVIFTQKKAFEISLEKYVKDMIASFEMNNSTTQDLKKDLDVLQSQAQCCGWTGQEDFREVPCSCYKTNATDNPTNQGSGVCCKSISNYTCVVYEKNCRDTITGWLHMHLMSILGVVLAVAVVECLQWVCLVTFCCLNCTCHCCRPRNTYGSHGQLSRSQRGCNIVKWSLFKLMQ
ncbi:leukocyte antigen CD37 isoform X2 [Ictalurus punctatus]|uniref:Leukocyte antigen CD37 isoform X2 n=1 Tax=Ictalurus punctatus TaxID=7998 RepID=A0A9F7RE91_ICTPU|nr:leukocyte antigen CD37 isoform X2 [Ictalurus punctatus]